PAVLSILLPAMTRRGLHPQREVPASNPAVAKLARIGTRRDRACPGVDPEQDCVRVLPAGPDRLAKKWPPKLAARRGTLAAGTAVRQSSGVCHRAGSLPFATRSTATG